MGFLVFGSENFHHSFNDVTLSIKNFSSHFTQITNQTRVARDSIRMQMNGTLFKFENELRRAANQSNSNSFNNYNINRQLNEALKEMHSIRSALNESVNSLEPLNHLEHENNAYNEALLHIDMFEQTRWAIMIGIVSANMFLIFLLIVGLAKNSRGALCL